MSLEEQMDNLCTVFEGVSKDIPLSSYYYEEAAADVANFDHRFPTSKAEEQEMFNNNNRVVIVGSVTVISLH